MKHGKEWIAFPQGQIFYTADISFGQATLYVNQIWKTTFPKYPKTGKKLQSINVSMVNGSSISEFDIAGVASNLSDEYILYMVNWGNDLDVLIDVGSGNMKNCGNGNKFQSNMTVIQLKGVTGSDTEENTPIFQNKIVPKTSSYDVSESILLPHNSYTGVVLTC